MSEDETLTRQEQEQFTSLFNELRAATVEAPPFLKTRVLAHTKRQNESSQKLFFWKSLAGLSLFAFLLLGVFSWNLYQNSHADGMTKQAYVIHVDFNQADKNIVAKAEIELPKDVHFVSSRKEVREESRLTLPVDIKATGRGKLPFVVSSDFSGEKLIKVRLLNEDNQLVREQILKLKFAKEDSATTLQRN